MEYVELFGYKVYKNGDIIGLNGKKFTKNRPQIKIYWGKNKVATEISYARFVFYAFNFKTFNFHDKSIIIEHINGNKEDYSINNLIAIKRGNKYHGENHIKAKLTDKQVQEIKDIYKQKDNGIYDKNYPFSKISYRKIAEEYGVSHTLIKSIVKGTCRNQENYIMN